MNQPRLTPIAAGVKRALLDMQRQALNKKWDEEHKEELHDEEEGS